MLEASSIGLVLDVYPSERACLLELLTQLDRNDWARRTECPAYSVKGIATHVLGDDLSLLSRQRDGAVPGPDLISEELSGADVRRLLDAFNDQWVAAARFFSSELLIELLRRSGEWTADYYRGVDPESPGESVALFGASQGANSPFWQAIAREYLERWIHHSQIRRALEMPSLSKRDFLQPGMEVCAAIARMEPEIPSDDEGMWMIGPLVLGPAQQSADILTRGQTVQRVRELLEGPSDLAELFAAAAGKP